jgi:hypothetical protein
LKKKRRSGPREKVEVIMDEAIDETAENIAEEN